MDLACDTSGQRIKLRHEIHERLQSVADYPLSDPSKIDNV
jgi:hypothetical protein